MEFESLLRKMIAKGQARKAQTRRPIVVELGYLGYAGENRAERLKRLAARFNGAKVIGIDLGKGPQEGPKNVRLIEGDFSKGLAGLADESVDRIESFLSLGHYDKNGKETDGFSRQKYVQETLALAYKKLKKGGKIILVAGEVAQHVISEATRDAGLKEGSIRFIPLAPSKKRGTHWMKQLSGTLKPVIIPPTQLYKIIITKN